MSFSREDLALLEERAEVDIETRSPDSDPHRATIWVVVDDGQAYIRSFKGESARWYREAVENSSVAVLVDGRRIPATAIPATDPDSIERASRGFERKYAGDPAAKSMVRPEVLDTTLRLEPA